MLRALVPAFLLAVVCLSASFFDSSQSQDVRIETVPVNGHVSMLVAQGAGNIGVSVGEDGVLLVDDQFAPFAPRIREALAALSDKEIRFLINTHHHFDHTGGNESFGKAGATIVAHDNVRARLSTTQVLKAFNREFPPSPKDALPVITFADSMTLHFNGDEIRVIHVAPAHTDGDSVIHFVAADVVHTGDLFFNGMGYPFFDTSSGGSLDGMIAAADKVLSIVGENTRIIPGHGPLSNAEDLREFREMMATVSARVHELVRAGKGRDEVIATKPTKDLDALWAKGMIKPDDWIGFVYDGIVGAQ